MSQPMVFEIELNSPMELPLAYMRAVEKFKASLGADGDCDDVWDGRATLIELKFESNFRRETWTAVIEVRAA